MMNKKMIMVIGAMAIAAVLGLIFSQNLSVSAGPDLTEEDVEDKVKAQYPGEITELELDEQGKNPVYEVEVVIEEKEYELQIDGNSGEVLKLEEKRVAKTDKKNERKPDKQKKRTDEKEEADLEMKEKINQEKNDSERKTVTAPKQEETKQEKKQEKQATKESNNNSDERKSTISTEKAIEIAQKQFSGTIDSIELDRDDGRLIYEIEIESSKGEAEIEIDAYTGEVLVVDIDLEDD